LIATPSDITAFIASQPAMVEILRAVEALCLPDCWVGAGFVRNPIWDALHGFPWSASYTDVDVVYCDAAHADAEHESLIEHRLALSLPTVPWSVKNQARMHVQNGDPPYANTADASRHWPKTCTAIAARSLDGRIELLAPFGVADLVSLTVKPTPAFAQKMEVYGKQYIAVLSGVGGWAGIGMAAGLTKDTDGLGAVGAYKALANYTQLGGVLTVFGLPE
jgi:hypothetical protein